MNLRRLKPQRIRTANILAMALIWFAYFFVLFVFLPCQHIKFPYNNNVDNMLCVSVPVYCVPVHTNEWRRTFSKNIGIIINMNPPYSALVPRAQHQEAKRSEIR